MSFKESKKRTTLRLVLWRFCAFTITIITSLILTQSIKTALEIGLADVGIKLIGHYLFERGWNRIKWGKIDTSVAPSIEVIETGDEKL